jgi:hypothetical protein
MKNEIIKRKKIPLPKPKTEPLPLGDGYTLKKKNGREFSIELLEKYSLLNGKRIAIFQVPKRANRPVII